MAILGQCKCNSVSDREFQITVTRLKHIFINLIRNHYTQHSLTLEIWDLSPQQNNELFEGSDYLKSIYLSIYIYGFIVSLD